MGNEMGSLEMAIGYLRPSVSMLDGHDQSFVMLHDSSLSLPTPAPELDLSRVHMLHT